MNGGAAMNCRASPVPCRTVIRQGLFGLLAIGSSLILATPSWAQVRSTMTDSVRGVTFHSLEISDDRIDNLEVLDGAFSPSDRLVVGLSTMQFDGSGETSNHIFWIRHEGRRWLDYDLDSPVAIVAHGWSVPLEPLRSPQPLVAAGGRMIEKLEFLVDSNDFDRLLSADHMTVQLRSETGDMDKVLSNQEIRQLREFIIAIESGT